jgi:hypothetical protein
MDWVNDIERVSQRFVEQWLRNRDSTNAAFQHRSAVAWFAGRDVTARRDLPTARWPTAARQQT